MIDNSKALDRLFYSMPVDKLKDDRLHYIDLHIIDGCNHSCARCVKFAPLCEDRLGIVNYNSTIKDLKRLSQLTNARLDGISILGGEPLISPDLIKYMHMCRKLFPNTSITIVTNGLAIPRMKKLFFKSLKKYDVWLSISKFYEPEVYEGIIDILKKNDCFDRTVFQGLQPFNCVMFVQLDLDEKGKQNKEKMFEKCPNKNGYITLKEGRLWSCPTSCMKYILNNYFGTKFELYKDDGVDIYNHTEKEIVELLRKPKEACKYCTVSGLNRLYFPETSKRAKDEWIRK